MAKREELRLWTLNEVCAQCSNLIERGQPSYSLYAKSAFDLSPKGKWVQIRFYLDLHRHKIIGFIVAEGSKASEDGIDICFSVCREECLTGLQNALKKATIRVNSKEIKLFKDFENAHIGSD